LLEIARRVFESQWGIEFRSELLRQPRVEEFVVAAKRDRSRPDHRDDLAFLNPLEEVVPKGIVWFGVRRIRPQIFAVPFGKRQGEKRTGGRMEGWKDGRMEGWRASIKDPMVIPGLGGLRSLAAVEPNIRRQH
jgi:hypothetical protein